MILNCPYHPCVMPTHEVLEDDKYYYVVMQQASEGSFFESLVKDFPTGVVPSATVKTSLRDILDAVRHLHEHGILHRDIKPDNLVVHRCRETGEKRVMLVDFDHADLLEPPEENSFTFGTLRYNASETFYGKYTKASDLYSIGVILYLIMSGKMPYEDSVFWTQTEQPRSGQQIFMSMKYATIDWACSPWPEQPICRDFCRRLLAFHPKMRTQTCESALEHRWFRDDEEDSDHDNDSELSQ